MLRLRLEKIPYGEEQSAYTIGIINISNIGGTEEFGDYDCALKNCNNQNPKIIKISKFERGRGAWELAKEAVKLLL